MRSLVSIAHADDIADSVSSALGRLEGLDRLFAGRHVAIKPNETWASARDTTACTRGDTLRAVIRAVRRFGPSRITVTGGAGAEETENVFRYTGIASVIREEGVEFFDHNRPPFVPVALDFGPQKEVMVNPRVLEYEALVSLAQLKVHYSAGVTLTMKNIAMSWPAADYYGNPRETMAHPHRFFEDLHGFITGMCRRFPITLGIVAGHPAMVGEGPVGGTPVETGLVIAGTDFVAVDCVGARLLGRNAVRHISEAGRLGMGCASFREIDIAGLPFEEAAALFRDRCREAARV